LAEHVGGAGRDHGQGHELGVRRRLAVGVLLVEVAGAKQRLVQARVTEQQRGGGAVLLLLREGEAEGRGSGHNRAGHDDPPARTHDTPRSAQIQSSAVLVLFGHTPYPLPVVSWPGTSLSSRHHGTRVEFLRYVRSSRTSILKLIARTLRQRAFVPKCAASYRRFRKGRGCGGRPPRRRAGPRRRALRAPGRA
jgi:hypothetical protein